MYMIKRISLFVSLIMFTLISVYLAKDFIKFSLYNSQYILTSPSYNFINTPDKTIYKFIIQSEIANNYDGDNSIKTKNLIGNLYDTNIKLQSIIIQKDRVLLQIVYDTKWKFISGKSITNNEYTNIGNEIISSGPNEITLIVYDELGNRIDSSAVGFGFEDNDEYFMIEISRNDFDEKKCYQWSFLDVTYCNMQEEIKNVW